MAATDLDPPVSPPYGKMWPTGAKTRKRVLMRSTSGMLGHHGMRLFVYGDPLGEGPVLSNLPVAVPGGPDSADDARCTVTMPLTAVDVPGERRYLQLVVSDCAADSRVYTRPVEYDPVGGAWALCGGRKIGYTATAVRGQCVLAFDVGTDKLASLIPLFYTDRVWRP